jgi:hypothetical protein
MRPLLRCLARPMNDEWKIRPYLGVLPRVFSALQQNQQLPQEMWSNRGSQYRQQYHLCMCKNPTRVVAHS